MTASALGQSSRADMKTEGIIHRNGPVPVFIELTCVGNVSSTKARQLSIPNTTAEKAVTKMCAPAAAASRVRQRAGPDLRHRQQ